MSITTIQSIPLDLRKELLDLRKELHDYHIPFLIIDRILNEMNNQDVQGRYKKVQVFPTDPKWCFVWRYFHHDKPNMESKGFIVFIRYNKEPLR